MGLSIYFSLSVSLSILLLSASLYLLLLSLYLFLFNFFSLIFSFSLSSVRSVDVSSGLVNQTDSKNEKFSGVGFVSYRQGWLLIDTLLIKPAPTNGVYKQCKVPTKPRVNKASEFVNNQAYLPYDGKVSVAFI